MLNFSSFELTPKQEDLISFYRDKWQCIARSSKVIDRTSITTAINCLQSY